jgi:deaminated glutathione amidase
MPIAACIQINGSSDVERNLARTAELAREAANAGALLIATPEATTYLGPHDQKVALAEPVTGPTNQRLAALAAELGVWLLVGSVAERLPDEPSGAPPTRAWNTSLLYGPAGDLRATYRKLHLFDVDLKDVGGVRFAESERTAAGEELVVATTPLGRLGLSICYDLRFPEMYGALVQAGAEILAVPSAFTAVTGKDHWHVLLRARAIEAQAWVLAPAQWGAHDDRGLRQSYGHSLIIDPWGEVVAEVADGEGWCSANIDLQRVSDVRRRIPVSGHRRLPLA